VERNISNARAALNTIPGGASKPIWITEIGWPVVSTLKSDGHHLPVTESVQSELLGSVLDMIKRRSLLGKKKALGIENVFYYDVQDWIDGHPPESSLTEEWSYRCGLREEYEHGEAGRYRKAWHEFQKEADFPGGGTPP
jgi:hypothetical protein